MRIWSKLAADSHRGRAERKANAKSKRRRRSQRIPLNSAQVASPRVPGVRQHMREQPERGMALT